MPYFFLALLCLINVQSQKFACLGKNIVNCREGPGPHCQTISIFKKANSWPVIIEREKDGWCFIQDYLGRNGWVKKKMLSMRYIVLTKDDDVKVYRRSRVNSAVCCVLRKGCYALCRGQKKKDILWLNVEVDTSSGKKIKGWVQACHLWPTP